MIYKKQKKVALSDIEKDQQTIKRLVAQSLAKKFPLYEAGRNTVGFLNGMVSQELTDRITDLFRGHSREMQNEIADAIQIYVIYQEIDLTGVKHVDDELYKIFGVYDSIILS